MFGLFAIAAAGCSRRVDDEQESHESIPPHELPSYDEAVAQLHQQRTDLREAYRLARGTAERREVIGLARQALVAGLFENLMPHWLGTRWDFNGISEVPGEGKIACGYFVSTLLRDAGLSVERIRMAQQASQNIIRSLTSSDYMVSFHGGEYRDFVRGMEGLGDGLYIIGLDRHVGFIVQGAEGSFFVHSDGGAHQCVVKEPLAQASALQQSRYRIVGCVSADDSLIGRWLSGEEIPTVR
ncbi:MAG: hypothetical protein ACR2RV_03960 [Verrucomicrobiales bacterium]